MSTIWKYRVWVGRFSHFIPKGATFLAVRRQGDYAQMWFQVDQKAETEEMNFMIRATGQPFEPEPGEKYLGTFEVSGIHGESLIFHAYQMPLLSSK